jgi:hypothetical protein
MPPTHAPPVGVWLISGVNYVPDEDGILVMLREGRCVQFPTSITPPGKNPVMRLWYACPDAKTIRFRMRPHGDEWLRFVENTPQGWSLIYEEGTERVEYPCRAATPEDLPDWFPEMLAENLKKMEAMEDKEDKGDPAEQAAPSDGDEPSK